MNDIPDPAAAVMDALKDLRRVFHARDWCDNRRWVGDSSEIRTSWKEFGAALGAAYDVIHDPKPGQGLASIWLNAVGLQAMRIENALDTYANDWQQLLFRANDVLNVLLEACWEKGCYLLGFGKSERRPIAKAILRPVSAISKLRALAKKWKTNYPTTEEVMSPPWRESREKYVQQAAKYLLEAVNDLEVAAGVIDNDFCTRICNDINEPENLVWPRILDESPDSLHLMANWLSGTQSSEIHRNEPSQSLEVAPSLSANANASATVPPKIPKTQSPSGKLKLFQQGEPIELCGQPHPKLTMAQYNVLMTLCIAGTKALSKDELEDKSGHPSARTLLSDLLKTDTRWAEVIQKAGKTGGGYRVL